MYLNPINNTRFAMEKGKNIQISHMNDIDQIFLVPRHKRVITLPRIENFKAFVVTQTERETLFSYVVQCSSKSAIERLFSFEPLRNDIFSSQLQYINLYNRFLGKLQINFKIFYDSKCKIFS